MRLCLLASGSKGNAALLDDGHTCLLIDAGLSGRELCRRLDLVGVSADSIDALLITHEHADHIKGLAPMVRRFHIPVHLHTELAGRLADVGRHESVQEFETGAPWQIGEFVVEAFPVSHDSIAPVGFTINGSLGKIGFATDLGMTTRLVECHLQNCKALVIETNHDEEMLRDGPYPWHLKQRIKSNRGHLSNTMSGQLVQNLVWPGLNAIFLAHLSDANNCPQLACRTVQNVLNSQNQCAPQLTLGLQDVPTGWVDL